MENKTIRVPSTTVIAKPQSTIDYDSFKYVTGNRQIDRLQVNRLVRSMKELGNRTDIFPIIVNENMEIIDGQHRLEALKELQMPVHYLISDGASIEHIRMFNSSQKAWGWLDFAKSHADRGNLSYERFVKLAEEFSEFNFGILILFAVGKQQKFGLKNQGFHAGDLELGQSEYETARERLARMTELSRIVRDKSRPFCFAAYELMKTIGYDPNRMVKVLQRNRLALVTCYEMRDYYYKLEELYRKES